MEIIIPGDGFCGTHALFLRMLMTLYTRDATLTKLHSSLEALRAIGVAHTYEPYDKPAMIEILQPIVSAFPLQELIEVAQRDQEMSADDVLERAFRYTQRSISELEELLQNANFVALRSKFHTALGPNSSQDHFNAAARDIIMAFIQPPSGSVPDTRTLPNYHAMLRAFMETIVESDFFKQTKDEFDPSPNMGNLLACFKASDYSQTTCDSSLYTNESDILVVNDLFHLGTIHDNILGIAVNHVRGDHFDMTIPDSGFSTEVLRSSPRQLSLMATTNAPEASSPLTTNYAKQSVSPGSASETTSHRPLTKVPSKNLSTGKGDSHALLSQIQKQGQQDASNLATERNKTTLTENIRKVSEKIENAKRKVATVSPEMTEELEVIEALNTSISVYLDPDKYAQLSVSECQDLNSQVLKINRKVGDINALANAKMPPRAP